MRRIIYLTECFLLPVSVFGNSPILVGCLTTGLGKHPDEIEKERKNELVSALLIGV